MGNEPAYNEQYISEPVKSDEIYANVMQDERVANILSQTSPDNQLVDIEWRIKGYKKNPYSKQWEKIDKKIPEPHPLLVTRYISMLSSLMNDNTRFTNLSGNEINKIMNMVIEWVCDDLDTNAQEYGLQTDYTERTRIGFVMLGQTFIVLKRSQDGMESRRVWNAINLNQSDSMGMGQQKKKGFLSMLNPGNW